METASGSDIKNTYPEFLNLAGSYFSSHSVEMITEALTIAAGLIGDKKRYDGTPFLNHAVHTAMIVISEIGLGRNSTISTIMHDPVRMGLISAAQVGKLFGEECTGILKGLCNISDVNIKIAREQADNFRDLIVSYSHDPRVILIKLADRLEVMRSLSAFPPSKREKKSWESLKLYAQIAHKLGLYSIKSELEDISLSYLEPEAFNEISSKLADSARERELMIEKFLEPIRSRLDQLGVKYKIKSRTKTIYSIWNKMNRMNIPFEEIFDIFALRIVVDCPRENEKQLCWGVYSIVTDHYTPNPDRLRDWISIPKSNGYESLHTTVVTDEGKWVEIQIRSERMDEVAERGIAAHWRYKGVNQGGMGSEQWLAKLRELMENDTQTVSKKFEGLSTMGEVFVFTPSGDLRKLPEGATLLDFAFDIHTDVGASCTGGRINQRNSQLREPLRNGDIVEIYTSKSQKPKPDWLNVVTTSKARGKIKAYLREEKAKAADLGREQLERKIKNWKLSVTIDDAVTVLCKYYKLKTGTELYGKIADGHFALQEIKELITRHLNGESLSEHKLRPLPAPRATTASTSEDSLVIDDSIKNIEYKLAKCCNPIRGDGIFGFVTINSGITVHRDSCPNAVRLKERYPYRVMPAKWRDSKSDGAFQATIRVVTDNITGMLNRITEVITQDLKINIRSMSMNPSGKGELQGIINIEVTSTQIVDMVVHNILKIKGVQRAYRVNS